VGEHHGGDVVGRVPEAAHRLADQAPGGGQARVDHEDPARLLHEVDVDVRVLDAVHAGGDLDRCHAVPYSFLSASCATPRTFSTASGLRVVPWNRTSGLVGGGAGTPAGGSATYSNSPLPSGVGPLAQDPSAAAGPSEKLMYW